MLPRCFGGAEGWEKLLGISPSIARWRAVPCPAGGGEAEGLAQHAAAANICHGVWHPQQPGKAD